MGDLATVATGMRSALQEMGLLVRDSSLSISDRQERALADLAAVASGMRTAQIELATLLRDSSVGFAGNMSRAVTDLITVAENMKSAQGEMAVRLNEAAIGFGGQMSQTLADLSRSSTALITAQKETQEFLGMAPHLIATTENFLERFQASIGEKFESLDQTLLRVQGDSEAVIQSLIQFMEQSREASRQEGIQLSGTMVRAGQLFLNATEKLDGTMANFFTNSLEHFSQSNAEMTTGLHQMNDQMLSRLEQQRASLLKELSQWRQDVGSQSGIVVQENLRQVVEPLSHTISQLTEEISHTKTSFVTQLRDTTEVMVQFSGGFSEAQNRFTQLVETMESGAIMMVMAGEKLQNGMTKVESVTDALSATQETARQTLNAILKAYDQLRVMWHDYESRFEQVNSSLERTFVHLKSGLQLFAERVLHFVNGVNHMDSITEKLGYVIGGLGTKMDSMNNIMSGFLAKMPDQSKSIQAMQDTSQQISHFVEKIHAITVNLDGLAATISTAYNNPQKHDQEAVIQALAQFMMRSFEKMTETLIQSMSAQSMHDTSRQIIQAGDKIHASMENLNGLASAISTASGHIQNKSEEAQHLIGETYDRMQTIIDTMQNQMDATLTDHQIHFSHVNTSMQESMAYIKRHFDRVSASMQQTMAYINNDLSAFSSEKILEFIGGVDGHMEIVNRQLRDSVINFNNRLDELNDLVISIIERMR
ncbi:hypothetical protein CCP3SC1AL1_2630003 [Gammaproteobacteria bacterium]